MRLPSIISSKPVRVLRTAALSFALVTAAGCAGEAGPAGPQGPKGDPAAVDPSLSTMDKAFVGMGGKESLQNLQNFVLETSGQRYVSGEGYTPDQDVAAHTYDGSVVRYDVKNNRLAIDHKRTVQFLGFNAAQTYRELINGNLGYLDGMESIFGAPGGNLLSDRTAAIRRQQTLLNPHLLLKEAASNPAIAQNGGPALLDGSLHQVLVFNDPVYPLSLYVNAHTGQLSKLVTLENDHLHRDIPVEVHYMGWQSAGSSGLLFPKEVFLAVNGRLLLAETRKSVTVNATLEDALFAFPASASPVYSAADAQRGTANHQFHMSFAGIGIPLDGQQLAVQGTELSPGVWFIGGSSHNSLAIEQAQGIVIVEAPLYPERSTAIINWVKSEPSFENKPITHVLATHHHDDHSAGLRGFIAEGAKVVVHESTAGYFREIFRSSSTVVKDPLALKPSAITILPVADGQPLTLADATNPVTAYHLETAHARDALLFYVGNAAKVAFSSDLYNPGNGGNGIGNGPKELYKAITETHKLDVATVAGGHGATAPISELQTLATK
jgi:glyoxylase-like metal-dependent hydrolase (beta-lactamase superfamily II)